MGKKRRVTLGEFGPVSGPVTAAGVSLATAGWGDVFGLSPWWAAATAGACGLLTLANAARQGLPAFARIHQVGCWIAYGAWTCWAMPGGPWDVTELGALASLGVITGVTARGAQIHVETVREHQKQVEEVSRRRGLAGEWERRLVRVCRIKGVTVTGLDEWVRPVPGKPGKTRKTGYSLLVELPSGGYRWTDINAKRLELASDANLPTGCGIEVHPGERAREVIIDVTTVNVLAEDLPLPQVERRSIYDPIPLGMRPDGRLAEVPLKWTSGVLIGRKGSGKSNQLVSIMSGLLCCDDVVVFGIDFNGGGVFRPYLRPWLDGDAERPAIDWVATDEAEAARMLDFAIAAIQRKVAYADLMEQVDDDKVPSSADIPHIIVISDETADLPLSIKQRLVELSNRGRAASISTLACALRAVDAGGKGLPIDLNKQAAVKISMQVDSDNELAYLFDWGRPPKSEEIPGTGFGFYGAEGDKPSLFKGYRTKPSTAREVAAATAAWRPALDEATIDMGGREVYETRWERARETWLSGKRPAAPAPAAAAAGRGAAGGGEGPEVRSAAEVTGEVAEGMADLFARLGLEMPQVGPVTPPPRPAAGGLDTNEEQFRAIVDQDLADVSVPALVSVAIEECGDEDLVHMATVARRFGVDSRRLGELMRMIAVEPRKSPWRGGKAYERDVLVAAADRIRRGLQQVPDEVWAVVPLD